MNDNTADIAFADRKAFLASLVANLLPGADGRAGMGAIYRELEAIRPGSLDQAHARLTARRLGTMLRDKPSAALPDLSFLDWPQEA